MAFRIASLFAEFRAKGLTQLSASMGVLRGGLAKVGVAMASAAKAVKIGSLAIAASIGIGIWQAIKFEKQMAHVSTMLTKVNIKDLPMLSKGIRKLSTDFGEATESLTSGLHDFLSAGMSTEDSMAALEAATKLAIGGFTSSDKTTKTLIATLNAYGMAGKDATKVSDMMFAAYQKGVFTMDELASTLGTVTSTAAMAGVPLGELLAIIATVTQKGLPMHQAMTGVAGVFMSFTSATEDAKVAFEKLFDKPMTLASLKAIGLTNVLKKLESQTADQIAVMFPNRRAIRVMAAALQDASTVGEHFNYIMNTTGGTQEALGKASDTTAHQLDLLKQGFLDTVRTVGDALLPVIRRLAEGMTGLSSRFNELVDWIRPVGVALEQLWGVMEKAFDLSGLWETITGALGKAATAVRDFVTYAVATLTTLVGRWNVVWDTMKMAAELALRSIWEEVKFTFTDRIPYAAKWMVQNVWDILKVLGTIVAKMYMSYAKTWYNALKLMVTMAKDMFIIMWDYYKKAAIAVFKAVPNMLAMQAKALKKIWEMIWNPLETAKGIADAVKRVREKLTAGEKTTKIPLFGEYSLDAVIPDLKDEMKRLKELAASFEMPGRVLTDREKELYQGIIDNIKMLSQEIGYETRLAFAKEGAAASASLLEDKASEAKKEPEVPIKVLATLDRGSWSGLADVWKNIQTTIMRKDPLLKEAKEQTGVLTDIRDAVKDLDVSGGATVREGGV